MDDGNAQFPKCLKNHFAKKVDVLPSSRTVILQSAAEIFQQSRGDEKRLILNDPRLEKQQQHSKGVKHTNTH